VIEGSFGETDQSIDVLAPAKIPVIATAASTQKALTTPGVFVLTNSLSYYGTPIQDAAQAGVKKLDLLVINVPAAAGPAAQLAPLLGSNVGVAVKVVAVPTGTADMSPQVASALKDKPGGFFMLGDPTFCTTALKAVKSLAPTTKVWGIDRCIGPSGGASIPGGYEGVRIVSAADLDTSRPDGAIYAAALAKYGDGEKVESQSGVGYTAVLGMVLALNAAKVTDVTPAAITAGMKAMPATPLPLSAGGTFQCDGKQIQLAPNVCAAGGVISTADKDGKLPTYTAVTPDPKLYTLPGGGS
jgi:branched-chain amino acid transport system substrate-binding protein